MGKHDLALFGGEGQVPAHIAAYTAAHKGNIPDRVTVPSLSYSAGKFYVSNGNGETRLLETRDQSGEKVPVSILRVIILDWAKNRGRTYYEGTYDADKPGKPLCWSEDGITPHASGSAIQHETCNGCPKAQKGSLVDQRGKAVVACGQHRMLAVVPASKPDMAPLRLKISITSDWDKKSPDAEAERWFAFKNYTEFLRKSGVNDTATIVTKLKFDAGVTYSKLFFSPVEYCSPETLAIVGPKSQTPEVQKLLIGGWGPEGADGQSLDDDGEGHASAAPAPAPKPSPAPKPKAAAAPPPPAEDDDEFGEADPAPAPAPAPKPKAAAAPKPAVQRAKAAPPPPADDDEFGEADPAPAPAPAPKPKAAAPAPAPAPKPKAASPISSSDVDDVMENWDE